jgi:tetratricopeptide (TPR) repeat protein
MLKNLLLFLTLLAISNVYGQKKAEEAFLKVDEAKENRDWNKAYELNNEVVETYPNFAPTQWFMVEYAFTYEMYKEAISFCDKYYSLLSKKDIENRQKALWFKGTAQEYLKDFTGAINTYDEGLAIAYHEGLTVSKGRAYSSLKEFDLSKKVLFSVLSENKLSDTAWKELANVYELEEHIDSALIAIDKAITIIDYKSEYYAKKAELLYYNRYNDGLNSVDEILKNSAAAIALSQGRNSRMNWLFESVAENNYSKAINVISTELNKKELDVWYEIRAKVYSLHGKHLRSKNEYTQLIISKTLEEASYYLYFRANENCELGLYSSAIEDYEKFLMYYPKYALGYGCKGDVYRLMGEYNLAIIELTTAIELEPAQPWYYYRRGWCKEYLKDYKGALADYNETIEMDSTYAYTYLNRGRLYEHHLNNTEKATMDYETILELDTVIMPSGNCRMYALMHLGMESETIDWLNAILDKYPNSGNYYDASCVYAQINKPQKAIEALRMAFEKGYKAIHHVQGDDDLDSIKGLPEYKSLIEEWKKSISKEEEEEQKKLIDSDSWYINGRT